jgi:hypothetical protein
MRLANRTLGKGKCLAKPHGRKGRDFMRFGLMTGYAPARVVVVCVQGGGFRVGWLTDHEQAVKIQLRHGKM